MNDMEFHVYRRCAALARYSGEAAVVTIPRLHQDLPVTEICAGAFAGNEALEVVNIPDTLRCIGDRAFENCKNLGHLRCSPLTEEPLPELLTEGALLSSLPPQLDVVGHRAFAGSGISAARFSAPSVSIGVSAFENCMRLDTVDFHTCKDLHLDKHAFQGSSLRSLYAPNIHTIAIPEGTFANCKELQFVQGSFNRLGPRSFYKCRQLETLNTDVLIEEVGEEALDGCDKLDTSRQTLKNLRRAPAVPVDPALQEGRDQLIRLLRDLLLQKQVIQSTRQAMDMARQERRERSPSLRELPRFVPRDSLFSLYLRESDTPRVPSGICGRFERRPEGVSLVIREPDSLEGTVLRAAADHQTRKYLPLLEFLASNGSRFRLYGTTEGNRFHVREIRSAGGQGDLPQAVLRQMLQRFQGPALEPESQEDTAVPYLMTDVSEMDAFLEMCKSRIPGWVRRAYEKNKKKSTPGSGYSTNSDDRRHTQRAMQLLANIDWAPTLPQVPDVEAARQMLDQELYGMEAAKERVLDVIAQIHRTGTLPKWGILFHGPAGIGKTAMVNAVAKVLGLPVIQMDMTTLCEEPDAISGSARIYGNAKPGMLLGGLFQNRSAAAVIHAGELDKAFSGRSGRTANDTLLSILDKSGLYENFLEEVVPTDHLFCIATCNDLSKISQPMRDRFHVITLPGYTPAEKQQIWLRHVLPRARKAAGIGEEDLTLTPQALDLLVSDYALDPGVRGLEQLAQQLVGHYCRHADTWPEPAHTYDAHELRSILGPGRRIRRTMALHPGQAVAAFCHEGHPRFVLVEAAVTPGSGRFQVLGPVGALQTDYCKAAFLHLYSAAPDTLSKVDVTVFLSEPVPDSMDNYLGLACFVAISTRIAKVTLHTGRICFLGGCDLNGAIFSAQTRLSPLLQGMRERGFTTLYAPLGTSSLVDPGVNAVCGITLMEAPDAVNALGLALSRPDTSR